jgi:predicted TIM-barrel fold metal-dependent hydrolase
MIIDSHAHLNKTDEELDFSGGLKRMVSECQKNSVDKIVIIADSEPNTNTARTDEIIDCVGEDDCFYVVGSPYIMGDNPNELDYFETMLRQRKIIGLKLFPGHETFYPTDDICLPVYELALKYNCPVIIHTGINSGDFDCAKYNDPKYIVEIAKKFPKLRIIIAHYFWPEIDYCFGLTKDSENIFYDTSALADPEVLELSGGKKKMKQILESTLAAKPHSVMFGSDYGSCNQKLHIDLINELNISDTQRTEVFSTNFLTCFNL